MGDFLQIEPPTSDPPSPDAAELSPEVEVEVADPQFVVLACLLALAVLTAAYFAADIVLPIVLAFVLSLLLQPAMRSAARFHVPAVLAACALILLTFATIVLVAAAFSGPAADWAQKLPDGVSRLEDRLRFLSEPVRALGAFLRQFDGLGSPGAPAGLSVSIEGALLKGSQNFASGFFETLLILFFLLSSGSTFLRRLVEIVPTFKDKRRVVALSQQIEENISAYLLTITLMNVAVGLATGLAMWGCGLANPIFWGGLAFILNFVPIIGPLAGVALFALAGLLSINGSWQAFLPALIYLGIHIIEGEALTPILVARRFTLNRVMVIVSIIFWFWMWGVPGAVLAVPMLAIAKIICDDVKPLSALGHFLEG